MSATDAQLLCRWPRCQAVGPYADSKTLFEHLASAHSPSAGAALFCHWDGCKRASQVCGPQNRARHFQIHAGYRPHRCADSGCGEAFYTEYDLKRHALEKDKKRRQQRTAKTEVEPAPVLGLPCRWAGCVRAFTEDAAGAARLAAHLAAEHCASSSDCQWADCTRKPRSSFKAHVLSHLPEWYKPFECDDCGETFQKSNALTRHANVAFQRGGCPKRRAAPIADSSSNKRRKLGHAADTLPPSSPPPPIPPSSSPLPLAESSPPLSTPVSSSPPPVSSSSPPVSCSSPPVSSSSPPVSSSPPPVSSAPPPYRSDDDTTGLEAPDSEMTVPALHMRLLSAEKLIGEMQAEMALLRRAVQDCSPGERDADFDWSLDD